MLAGIDLDLQPQTERRHILGIEFVDESDATLGLFPLRFAKPPIKNFAQRFHHRTRRLGPCLDKVHVFGIPRGGFEMKLVERRTAPERKSIAQDRMRENLDDRPADDQILLDLEVLDPGGMCPPLGDVVARDHSSASTLALT
jgi:hypothetical protein